MTRVEVTPGYDQALLGSSAFALRVQL